MEPNKFITEIYRRMDMEDSRYVDSIDPDLFLNNKYKWTKTLWFYKRDIEMG